MSQPLRRSQRLSQQYNNGAFSAQSAVSASSSTSSTSTSSPVCDSSGAATYEYNLNQQAQLQSFYLPPPSAAPLPSPSVYHADSYFDSSASQFTFQMSQTHQQSSAMPQQRQFTQAAGQVAQSANQHHNSFSSNQRPNLAQGSHNQSGGGGAAPPPGFLAEAAKRAQMACLMRDLGDVTL